LNFEIVYDSRYLPGADRIIQLGAWYGVSNISFRNSKSF
jgi:hypothetical protein